MLGTIVDFVASDGHARSRQLHDVIEVETVSLNDLLAAHHAPYDIDFISIDTEGSEYDILRCFDFQKWNVLLFSIEHNLTSAKPMLDRLMQQNGYEQRYAGYPVIDSWYRRKMD